MVLSFVSDAVNKVGPSVCRIDTETHMLGDDDGMPSQPPAWVQQGQGSGLLFSSEGLILTNAHVVEDATKVTVTLTDGRMYKAEVLGSDEIVDISVIKIIPESRDGSYKLPTLPVAELGDSDKLKVGQIVIAVGSPGMTWLLLVLG
jgi:S1-C subfamily serine protease